MIVHNLSDGTVLIKHQTQIDPDDIFLMMENISEDLILFDNFFKQALKNKTIAIQLFEIVDNKISFSDYFAPKKIWEDTLQWMEWSNTFKGNHSICLYFYEPDPRQINLFDSSLDTDSRVTPTFNNETTEHESFLITDYNIHEHEINSTFQLHINTDVIYECLQKSSHQVCKNLLKEFSYHLLNQQLKAHVDKKTVLTKI